jgi:hypothetical protein
MKVMLTLLTAFLSLIDPTIAATRITFDTHPFRELDGKVYNFTAGIKWYRNRPLEEPSPYPESSPFYKAWLERKKKFELQKTHWSRYLLDGRVYEVRPEGVVVGIPQPDKEEQYWTGQIRGSFRVMATRKVRQPPKYLLLKNYPGQTTPFGPLFAIPVGYSKLGSVLVETFDYGTPLTSLPPLHSPRTNAAVSTTTNIPLSQFTNSATTGNQ